MKARVVHVHDRVPGAVYIGRAMPRQGIAASRWANPFRVGRDGTRAEVIAAYRERITAYVETARGREALRALAGRPLACWCRRDGQRRTPDTACHGDALIALLAAYGLEPKED